MTFLHSYWSWAYLGMLGAVALAAIHHINGVFELLDAPRAQRDRVLRNGMRWMGLFQMLIGGFLGLSGSWGNAVTLLAIGPVTAFLTPLASSFSAIPERIPSLPAPFCWVRPIGPPTIEEWLDSD